MTQPRCSQLDWLAYGLLALFAFDRLVKLGSVIHFFARKPPAPPTSWPDVTLFEPITRGVSGLPNNIRSRATLTYPGRSEHFFICDAQDTYAQETCAAILHDFPALQAQVLLVDSNRHTIATKIEKLQAALPSATGEVFCFIDDDIILLPDALQILLSPLFQPGVGAAFGLACHTNWSTIWSSLMSTFVNINALLNYIPITYLTEPFTITGHCFALQRSTFEAVGGMAGLEERVDDDHEMARRVRSAGLRIVQTPVIYGVDNHFTSLQGYVRQMKRWFIFPRQTMLPFLTHREQGFSLLTTIGQLIPALLILLTLFTCRRAAFRSLLVSLGIFGTVQAICELCYLPYRTPLKYWPLVPLMAIIGPLQVLWILLSKEEIEWRGQRLRIATSGEMEVLS
jgi:ceramide glucosyltransferase